MSRLFYCFLLILSCANLELHSQEVEYDISVAKELASSENKNILMVFSGSDWCKPCILLKREILDSDLFKSFSKNHLIHLELDFPYRKKNQLSKKQIQHNEALAEKYNTDGAFPKVLILNDSENVLGLVNYKKGMTPEQFVLQLENVMNDEQ